MHASTLWTVICFLAAIGVLFGFCILVVRGLEDLHL